MNYISVYNTNFSYSKNWTYPTLVRIGLIQRYFLVYSINQKIGLQPTGIGPVSARWKRAILPLNQGCLYMR